MIEDAAPVLIALSLGLALLVLGFAPAWRRSSGRLARARRTGRPVPRPLDLPQPLPAPNGLVEDARVHVLLGEVALQARNREKALEHFRRALSIDPSLGLKRTLEKLEGPPTLRRLAA